jgi:hypothetical protein
LFVALALVVVWTVAVAITGAATGLWEGSGPRGLRLAVGGATLAVDAAIAVGYRRISRPVGDLLGAAEQSLRGTTASTLNSEGLPICAS